MPVSDTDVHFMKSSAGDSEGGGVSAVEILGTAKNNFWQQATDVERLAGFTHTKKWFFENQHPTDPVTTPSFWVYQTPTNTTEYLGVGWDDTDDSDPLQGNMTAFGANAKVALVSDGPDTRTAEVVGKDGSGLPVSELLALSGTTEVLTTATFSVCYGVHLSATSGSRIVTAKQGTGGTVRGTIGVGKVACWLWILATTKGAGIYRPDLAAGDMYGFWDKLVATAGVGPTGTQSVVGAAQVP